MRHETIDGVVVHSMDRGDNNRYLSVLTAQRGRITLLAKGSHSLRGEQRAVSQLFTYANFEYYMRGEVAILKGGSPIESFYGLSEDIDRINLATYLCELVCELTDEGVEAADMLRMLLNSFYALATDLYGHELIKGAFEWRAAALSGYEPMLGNCQRCGCAPKDDTVYLDVMNGAVVCSDCIRRSRNLPTPEDDASHADVLCQLSQASLAALRYTAAAPLSRLFSFELTDGEDQRLFSVAAETYLLSHVGHGFRSLDFYREMKGS